MGLQVPPHFVGKLVQCPKCQNSWTIPDPNARPVSPPPPPVLPAAFQTWNTPPAAPDPRIPAPPSAYPPDRWQHAELPPHHHQPYGPDPFAQPPPYYQPPAANGLAVAGMTLGVIGFVLVFIPFCGWILALIFGLLGITFSAIGLGTAARIQSGKGVALTGLLVSMLALLGIPFQIYYLGQKFENQRKANDQNRRAFNQNPNALDLPIPPRPPLGLKEIAIPNLAARGAPHTLQIQFKQGVEAKIWIVAHSATDVDIVAEDDKGMHVATDFHPRHDCYISWIPMRSQSYRIVVTNAGNLPTRCTLYHNGS